MGGCRADQLAQKGDCSHLDSAAVLTNTPLKFQPREEKFRIIDETEMFAISDDLSFIKENVGYRVSSKTSYKHITDSAYDFLISHNAFTVLDLSELQIEGDARHKIINQLLGSGIIHSI